MFCPECGTKLPYTESIGGTNPIYECPKCEDTWVYDAENGYYAAYYTRQTALDWYGAEEKDIVPELTVRDRHSVTCYFCGQEFDERDGENADAYNAGSGGSICPTCLPTMTVPKTP